jgi:cation transport regulator ChaC
MWIFAYGSLVFRPGFPFAERRRAYVTGYARRFWQGSPDHRGVPGAPGRVATLVPIEGALCGGCGYRIDAHDDAREAILSELDRREQAGFERRRLALREAPGGEVFGEAITWVAAGVNPHFLGPLPEREIAEYVRERRGPSGANADYVLLLRTALRDLGIDDPHVEAIATHLASDNPTDQ